MAIEGKEKELDFQLAGLVKRRSRRVGPEIVTDFGFADDKALLSEELYQAQELLQGVESEVKTPIDKVGLKTNAGKTKSCLSIKAEWVAYRQMLAQS